MGNTYGNYSKMASLLKKLIDKSGKQIMEKSPYHLYQLLLREEGTDPLEAGALLLTMLAGIPGEADRLQADDKDAVPFLTEKIKHTCFFNEETAAALAGMYMNLYSTQNQAEWEKQADSGFKAFCSSVWDYSWEGHRTWRTRRNHSVYISYDYSVRCSFDPVDIDNVFQYFKSELAENPFLDEDSLFEIMEEDLDSRIEAAFEESDDDMDDYYPPTEDEFGYKDIFAQFCEENGFALVDFEEEGSTSDAYESDDW